MVDRMTAIPQHHQKKRSGGFLPGCAGISSISAYIGLRTISLRNIASILPNLLLLRKKSRFALTNTDQLFFLNFKKMKLTPEEIKSFLYDHVNGFLMKYRQGKGIDVDLLNQFYDLLEELKEEWRNKNCVDKDILYELIGVVPYLYMDLPMYADREGCEDYEDILYNLNTAMAMCINPNTDDPYFNTPLKDLGEG